MKAVHSAQQPSPITNAIANEKQLRGHSPDGDNFNRTNSTDVDSFTSAPATFSPPALHPTAATQSAVPSKPWRPWESQNAIDSNDSVDRLSATHAHAKRTATAAGSTPIPSKLQRTASVPQEMPDSDPDDDVVPCPHFPLCQFRSSAKLMRLHVHAVHREHAGTASFRQIAATPSKHCKKIRAMQNVMQFRLIQAAVQNTRNGHRPVQVLLEEVLSDVLEPYLGDASLMLQVEIESEGVLDHSIINAPIRADQFSVFQYVERSFVSVLQSNEELGTKEPLTIRVTCFPSAAGGAHNSLRKHKANSFMDFVSRKKAAWDPQNGANDNSCFGSCILAGLRALANPNRFRNQDWYKRHNLGPHFQSDLCELYDQAGIDREQFCGPAEWIQFQESLDTHHNGVKSIILDLHCNDEVIFGEPFLTQRVKKIFLLLDSQQNHFYFISSIKSYLSPRKMCDICGKTFFNQHSCRLRCRLCGSAACSQKTPPNAEMIQCGTCKRAFYDQQCFQNHELREARGVTEVLNRSMCMKRHRCAECGTDYDPDSKPRWGKGSFHHVVECGRRKCMNCGERYRFEPNQDYEPHLCYCSKPDSEKLMPTQPIFTKRRPRKPTIMQLLRQELQQQQQDSPDNNDAAVEFEAADQPVREEDFEPGFGPEDYIDPQLNDANDADAAASEAVPCYNYLFYDYETYNGADGICYANLVVAQHVCSLCEGNPDLTNECPFYGPRERIFHGPSANEDFCSFLFSERINNVVTAIAHNASRFDIYFPLRYMLQNGLTPKMIAKGNKILMLRSGRRKFLDSLQWLGKRLSELPAMFGFESEIVKGTFPHSINKPENWGRRWEQLPSIECYDIHRCSDKESANAFEAWHTEHANEPFDFDAELIRYCKGDVTILRRACMEFRRIMIDTCQLDPFHCSITIASMCSLIYRNQFMPERAIGLVPPGGYAVRQAHSAIATKYLEWLNSEYHTNISHAGNRIGKEPTLAEGIRVDGVYLFDPNRPAQLDEVDSITEIIDIVSDPKASRLQPVTDANQKKAINIHGCFWHSCKSCYPDADSTTNPITGATMRNLGLRTEEMSSAIRQLGFELFEVWTCEIERELKRNPEMAKFFATYGEFPIGERDALYGGRTQGTRLRVDVSEFDDAGYEVHSFDFCSLYPSVQSKNPFPYGHPERLTCNRISLSDDGSHLVRLGYTPQDNQHLRGIVKCRMLPPRDLLLPVLPFHIRGKMIYCLCPLCAESDCQDLSPSGVSTSCMHTDDERIISGTWPTLEVEAALLRGYRFISAFEALYYAHWDALFQDYVSCFMKLKAESSGWPKHDCGSSICSTKKNTCDECEICLKAREDHVAQFLDEEGIELDPANVAYNAGKRGVFKAILNSMWGKLGQHDEEGNTIYPKSSSELHKLMADNRKQITSVQFATENQICVNYQTKNSNRQRAFYNPIIASIVTCYARLELLNAMELVGAENVLYFDTDSIYFLRHRSEPAIESSNCLGGLASELPPGEYITRFVATGPKSYAYETNRNSQKVCLKGITQDASTEDGLLSIDTVEQVLLASLGRSDLNLAAIYQKVSNSATAGELVRQHTRRFRACADIVKSTDSNEGQKNKARDELSKLSQTVSVMQTQFVKNKATATIRIQERHKDFRTVYDKRVIRQDLTTIPYGYISNDDRNHEL